LNIQDEGRNIFALEESKNESIFIKIGLLQTKKIK
tara:strand:+ start:82 stop:186 length:105 start_codon:yes stop_codon:yes gene_type:complete